MSLHEISVPFEKPKLNECPGCSLDRVNTVYNKINPSPVRYLKRQSPPLAPFPGANFFFHIKSENIKFLHVKVSNIDLSLFIERDIRDK